MEKNHICKKCGGIAGWDSYFQSWICTRCGNEEPKPRAGGRVMADHEIFARIAKDVVDVGNGMFSGKDITIWMTKDLLNRLCPEEFAIQRDSAMITLFGCKVKVVLFPRNGMQWIVGYEGTAEEGK